jgi:serine protease Do
MKSSSKLLAGLILTLLSGCTPAERAAMLAFTPDQAPKPTKQRQVNARTKAKTTKQTEARPLARLGSASQPTLPAWSVSSPMPSKVLLSTLTPSQLFTKVSPAVYALSAAQAIGQGTSQGSAVAVSSKEAITNCHVVANAKAITLANAATTLRAQVASADPSTDRCYLRVLDGELYPVPGVRDYGSLAVGEVVFPIGSPKGLVNSLGNGLLSGLRKSEGAAEYIQITAPVSEGSSGGGLFDDRGNLIGVTTFTVRDSQNLNFAIAASEFWR